jgi:hypothetical protein
MKRKKKKLTAEFWARDAAMKRDLTERIARIDREFAERAKREPRDLAE